MFAVSADDQRRVQYPPIFQRQARLVRVAALRIATAGEVSREYLRTQFTAEEIDVCWPLAEPRLPPAIRDLAMAA